MIPISVQKNWYKATDPKGNLKQIVFRAASGTDTNTDFRELHLLDELSSDLMEVSWAAAFSPIRKDDEPVLVVRADGACPMLRGCPMHVAFSFHKMKCGALATIFVEVECPSVAQRLKYPVVLFERSYGCDTEDAKKLFRSAIRRDCVHICFCDGPGEPAPPRPLFDVIIPLSSESRQALSVEYESLLTYHASIPLHQRSFQLCIKQLWDENPQDRTPILAETLHSSILVVDIYQFHKQIAIGLVIESQRNFPLIVGCSIRSTKGQILDIPARVLRYSGLALWTVCAPDECAILRPGEQRTPDWGDLRNTEWRGDIIFALWPDFSFTERLADTGWVRWHSPWLVGGSVAGIKAQEEEITQKYGARKDAWATAS